MLFKYISYYLSDDIVYDDMKLTVTYNGKVEKLSSPLVLYYGSYILHRGMCFAFITQDLYLHLWIPNRPNSIKYKLSNFPDTIQCSYYQCILTTGCSNIVYESEKIESKTIVLPSNPYTVSSNHIIYVKDNVLSSILLSDKSILYIPYSIRCLITVKRLYSYNLGCIIRSMNDKYYLSPYNNCKWPVRIMNKIYYPNERYVLLDILTDMDIVDIGYKNDNMHVYDGYKTYFSGGSYSDGNHLGTSSKYINQSPWIKYKFKGFEDIIIHH